MYKTVNLQCIPAHSDYRERQFVHLFKEGVSPYEIAKRWGVDPHVVALALRKRGIQLPGRSRRQTK